MYLRILRVPKKGHGAPKAVCQPVARNPGPLWAPDWSCTKVRISAQGGSHGRWNEWGARATMNPVKLVVHGDLFPRIWWVYGVRSL